MDGGGNIEQATIYRLLDGKTHEPLRPAGEGSAGAGGLRGMFDKRELKCACVGGASNVPLGFVPLTENLMVIAMAFWMDARALAL